LRADDTVLDFSKDWEGFLEYSKFIERDIYAYLSEDKHLPTWTCDHFPADLSAHLASLKIPTFGVKEFPCLLLHDLGRPSYDSQLQDRVQRLFVPGRTTYAGHIRIYTNFSPFRLDFCVIRLDQAKQDSFSRACVVNGASISLRATL
jgi:hypothetical protein